VIVQADARQHFVDVVRTRLDSLMAEAGFPLNGVYDDDEEAPNRNTSVLYEGVVADFLMRSLVVRALWRQIG